MEALKCDGVSGAKTEGAIRAFQRTVLLSLRPEGAIHPGDATLLSLCDAVPLGVHKALLSLVYLSADEEPLNTLTPGIVGTMTRYDIGTPLRQAHFLAQIGHESGELRFREETASGEAYESRRDLGNTRVGDGLRYKGRGLIQLTGRENYTKYARTGGLKVDVVANPALVATDHGLCVDVAGWFWDRRGLNQLADRDDLKSITRRINGGLNGLADRQRLLIRSKTLMGV